MYLIIIARHVMHWLQGHKQKKTRKKNTTMATMPNANCFPVNGMVAIGNSMNDEMNTSQFNGSTDGEGTYSHLLLLVCYVHMCIFVCMYVHSYLHTFTYEYVATDNSLKIIILL